MTEQQRRILVLGTGRIGKAMAHQLRRRHPVVSWEGLPPDGSAPEPLEPLVHQAEFVFFCMPVVAHSAIAPRVAAALPDGAVCVTIAKGLDDQGQTAAGILSRALGGEQALAALYGPMIAEDLQVDRLGFADLACARQDTGQWIRQLFRGSALKLAHTTDLTGASWAVVLKNVYVPLIGAADELQLGDNVRGALTTDAFRELAGIVETLGGAPASPYGLAGLGDFVGSATSADSHHRELGRRLARGETRGLEGEGPHTLAMIERHRLFDTAPYPLLRLAGRMFADPPAAAGLLRDYLQGWGV